MKGKDKLDQLVQRAQNDAPLMDIESIHELIGSAGSAGLPNRSKSFFKLKHIIMTSITTVCLLGVLYLWPGKSHPTGDATPVNQPQSAVVIKNQTKSPAVSNTAVHPITIKAHAPEEVHETKNASTADNEHDPRRVYHIIQAQPSERKSAEPNHPAKHTPSHGILTDHFFDLSAEEWQQLYVTADKKNFQYRYFNPVDSHFCNVYFNHRASRIMVDRGNRSEGTTMDDILLPMGFSQADGTGFRGFRANAATLTDSLRQLNELIGFNTPMKSDLLIWYNLSPQLLKAFPTHIRSQITSNKLVYTKAIEKLDRESFSKSDYVNRELVTKELAYNPDHAKIATDEHLKKLGFEVSPSVIMLKGRVKRGIIKFQYTDKNEFTSYKSYDRKLGVSFVPKLEHIPLFVSYRHTDGFIYGFTDHAKKQEVHPWQQFLTRRQGLLPVVYQPKFQDSALVFWYEPSLELLATLDVPVNEQNEIIRALLVEKRLAKVEAPDEVVELELSDPENDGQSGHSIKMIQLPKEGLAMLGIYVENNNVVYIDHGIKTIFDERGTVSEIDLRTKRQLDEETGTVNLEADPYMEVEVPEDRKNGKMVVFVPGDRNLRFSGECNGCLRPKYITDDLAQSWRAAEAPADIENRTFKPGEKTAYLDSVIATNIRTSYMIPILVRTGQKYTATDDLLGRQRPDCIFWFEPTDTFLSVLPEAISGNIRKEIISTSQKNDLEIPFTVDLNDLDTVDLDEQTCEYFEVCETQKLAITQHAIFPNPTRDQLNVNITAQASCSGTITVTSIDGRIIAQTDISLTEGITSQFSFSVQGIKGGIYLVNIQTDQGDYISQRIVKLD